MFKSLRAGIRALLRPDMVELELDDEIRFHIDRETEKNVGLGMSPGDARRAALLAFGGVEHTKESFRDGRGVRWLQEVAGDVRYALRTLARNPGLSAAATITLALGIGANAAIFSAVNSVLLRPLPFPASDRLVMLWEKNPDRGWFKQSAAPANMYDWRAQMHSIERL